MSRADAPSPHPAPGNNRGTTAAAPCGGSASVKVQPKHLARLAIVYVRQSTPQQVFHNRESTDRQYALDRRAVQLGWPPDRVEVVDEDQGQSGSDARGRTGFQSILARIVQDQVGIVLGLEMSRLARSNKDWHQLLETCAIFQTLLADQDGVYDPTDYNDRLLLGLKGTISEAELHILRSRMYEGMLNKARRGEIVNHPPIGYVKTPDGARALDPDAQVQTVVRILFEQFDRLGTVSGLLRFLVREGIHIPVRPTTASSVASWCGDGPTGSPCRRCCGTRSTPASTAGGIGRSIRAARCPVGPTRGGRSARRRSVWSCCRIAARPTSPPSASGLIKIA
jgi:DNA invertase Pin-like site-specific DNA recombinase